jgi:O-antigen ligase
MLLFGAWTALSFLWAKQKSGTPLLLVLTIAQLALFWVLIQASVQTWYELSAVSSCFIAGTLLAILVSVILPRWSLAPRLVFTTGNPNHLARDIVTSLLLLLYLVPALHSRARLVAIGSGALLVLSLVLTQSRASWIAAIVTVPITLIGHKKVFPVVALANMALAAVVLFALGVVSAHLGVTETVLEARWGSIFDQRSIRASRLDIWHAGIILGARSPLLGVGAGGFPGNLREVVETMPEYLAARPELDAHNSFVCAFGELGLVGLALLIGILWQCGRSIAHKPFSPEKMLAWALLVCVVCRMVFGTTYYTKTTWLALALGQVVLRKEIAVPGSEDDTSYEEAEDSP